MSSSSEDSDSDTSSSSNDDLNVSDNSSDSDENSETISSHTADIGSQSLNYNEEEDDPELFSVNLHEAHNKLKQFHPETTTANYNEIQILTRIKRLNGIIVDQNHKTLPILSKYERTKILGQRAKQIEDGDTPYITINNIVDPTIIALMELEEQKIPFIIRRPLPNGKSEYWNLNDLQIL
jgi:DNA-directed RNA polymerase I, II, and III subunit RPABC2